MEISIQPGSRPLGCLRSVTDPVSISCSLRTREDGQTHLLGIAAGSVQLPGAVAGSSPVLCEGFSVVWQSLLALRLCIETVIEV